MLLVVAGGGGVTEGMELRGGAAPPPPPPPPAVRLGWSVPTAEDKVVTARERHKAVFSFLCSLVKEFRANPYCTPRKLISQNSTLPQTPPQSPYKPLHPHPMTDITIIAGPGCLQTMPQTPRQRQEEGWPGDGARDESPLLCVLLGAQEWAPEDPLFQLGEIPRLMPAVPYGEHCNLSDLQFPHGKWEKNGTNLPSWV